MPTPAQVAQRIARRLAIASVVGGCGAAAAAVTLGGCRGDTFDASTAPPGDGGPANDAGEARDAGDAGPSGDAAKEGGPDASPDRGAFKLVQTVTASIVGANVAQAQATIAAGDVVVVAAYTGFVGSTLTDARTQSWTSAAKASNTIGGCNGPTVQLYYAVNAKGGNDTVSLAQTADATGERPLGFFLLEYAREAGATAPASDGAVASGSTGASNVMTTPSVTPSHDADLVVGLFADSNGGGVMGAGPKFQSLAVDSMFYAMVEDRGSPPAGASLDATATLPVGVMDACWSSAVLALEPSP